MKSLHNEANRRITVITKNNLKEKGVKSPDLSVMKPKKVNSKTIIFRDEHNKRDKPVNR
jgi:hypothetical protein